MKQKVFKIILLGLFLQFQGFGISKAAENSVWPNLEKKFTSSGSADHSVIFMRLSDHKVLFESGADKLLSPASVTKIVTSAAALTYFGPSFTFKTPIYHTGRIEAGHVTGDLIIKGDGDPFMVSEVLWQTAVDLHHLGIRTIDGNLIIDTSLFDDEDRDDSRKTGAKYSTHAYDAPVSSFAVNFNTVAVAIAPTVSGKSAIAEITPYAMPSVKLTGRVTTRPGEASDTVSAARTTIKETQTSLTVSGVIGEDAPIKKIYRSVADPVTAAGDYVRAFLENVGIKVRGVTKRGTTPKSAALVYEAQGYEMRRIAQGLNTFSNNFIADVLTKRLGAAFPVNGQPDAPGSGSLKNGTGVLNRFLREDVGLKGEWTLLNGSGLATENRLSARQLLSVMTWMESRGELFPDFLGSLPASGLDGTLKKRMKKDDDLRGLIRAKTGTLTEPITVASMAGYFRHPTEGWCAFVILSNGREGRGQPGLMDLRNLQDAALRDVLAVTH